MMTSNWFAVHVRPRAEHMVSMMLREKGYEEFLPLYSTRRPWSNRIKNIHLPLFPGYLFCKLNPNATGLVVATPGVLRIAGEGRTPASIDTAEVDAIRRLTESKLPIGPHPFLRVGQTVRLDRGSLCGLEGFVVRLKSAFRLVVSVQLLQRSLPWRSIEIGYSHYPGS